jgi:hypothetical protein
MRLIVAFSVGLIIAAAVGCAPVAPTAASARAIS